MIVNNSHTNAFEGLIQSQKLLAERKRLNWRQLKDASMHAVKKRFFDQKSVFISRELSENPSNFRESLQEIRNQKLTSNYTFGYMLVNLLNS